MLKYQLWIVRIFYDFLVLFTGYNIWGKQLSIQKKCLAHASASEAYIKKITVACPTDKGDAGRLTIVASKCSIMPLSGIRPGDGGTLTIIANKCSIVKNAPCRMNLHLPRPLPPSSSPIWAPPPPPAHPSPPSRTCRTMPIRLEVHVRGAGFKVAGATAITPSASIQSVS
jgi:hypothetical protein